MSEEISGLINRAKSEQRLENFFKFLGKNSKMLISMAVAFLLTGLVVLAISIYRENLREKYSAILHQSLIYQETGEFKKAKVELEKIVDSSAPSGVKTLANMRYAAFLLNDGDILGAQDIYQKVSSCKFCDKYAKNLASLLLVKLIISNQSEADDINLLEAQIIKIKKGSSVLRNQISEQLAIFHMLNENFEKSYTIFKEIIAEQSTSKFLRKRCEDSIRMILAKGFKPVK